jgi:hypothetical protein
LVWLNLSGTWEFSPSVVVGDMRHAKAVGTQKLVPPPLAGARDTLYWCEGDFRTFAVIKGTAPSPRKKYLWAEFQPGCDLYFQDPIAAGSPVTRVWFIREEGKYVRPAVDSARHYYLLHTDWASSSDVDARTRFGRLLLTPAAYAGTLVEFSQGFTNLASLAQMVLGDAEARTRVRELAGLGDPDLRREACDFLQMNFQEKCTADAK